MTARFQISGLFQHYQDPDMHEAWLGTSPLQAKRLITPQQKLFISHASAVSTPFQWIFVVDSFRLNLKD